MKSALSSELHVASTFIFYIVEKHFLTSQLACLDRRRQHHEVAQRGPRTLRPRGPEPSRPAQLHHAQADGLLQLHEAVRLHHVRSLHPRVRRQRELPPAAVLGVDRVLLVCRSHLRGRDTEHEDAAGRRTC